MADLAFSNVDGKWESEVVNFETEPALEIVFEDIPPYKGVDIEIFQSVSTDNWQRCYHITHRMEKVFCRTLWGTSQKAFYKVVCSEEPSSACYV